VRTYGKITNPDGTQSWVQVTTDGSGSNDAVYATALVQTVKLNINESPFYANSGIPAKPSVVQQLFPDYYVQMIQQTFAPVFANVAIARTPASNPPKYTINITTNQGVKITAEVAQ